MISRETVEKSIALRAIRFGFRRGTEFLQEREFRNSGSRLNQRLCSILGELRSREPERIVVVGNGPSLRLQNLELLANEFTICTNAFFHAYDRISWRPTVLTIEDPFPAADNADFYNTDSESVKLIPYDLRKVIRDRESTAYINFLRSYGHSSWGNWPRFSTDIGVRSYWGGTVSFLALQIAATFGPKEIVLIGTDLSYVVPKSAKVAGLVITSTEDDPNHFHPSYFGAGKKWHLPETERMQRSFEYAFQALSDAGIGLINATAGGNLRVVPRRPFEEIFG